MTSSRAVQIEACPACETKAVDESIDMFDGVCTGCGFVIRDTADTTAPDWLVTDEAEEQSDKENWLSTCRIRNATEQRIAEAFGVLEEIADQLDLDVALHKDAAEAYCDAFCAETTDGRDTTSLVAACLRVASLRAGRPVPSGRLTDLSNVDKRQFRLACTALREDLEYSPATPEPIDYVSFLSKALPLSNSQKRATEKTVEAVAGDLSLVGKDPTGIAAAASYLRTSDQTQSNVADAVGVSTETIRLRSNQLEELMSRD